MLALQSSVTPEEVVNFTRTAAPYLWGLWLSVLLAQPLMDRENRRYCVELYKSMRPRHIGSALLIAALTLAAYFTISSAVPALDVSWLSLLSNDGSSGQEGSNVLIAPATLPVLGPIFIALLMFNMPLITRLEERLFRGGTRSYLGAIPRSLVFGLAHCLVGVPVAAGLAIAIPGMWFTHAYMAGEKDHPADYTGADQTLPRISRLPIMRSIGREMVCSEGGGVQRAALAHTCYNALLLIIASSLLLVASLW
ncbi:MAG: hypothetical protein L0G70_01030 [Rubrobacter sp.]|nr:hypothetical protein [Rubrobacter sp.]